MITTPFPIIALVILSIFIIIIALSISIPLIIVHVKHKRIDFVDEHSVALKKLKELNKTSKFYHVEHKTLTHEYDDDNMFQDIEPEDYLIYKLENLKDFILKNVNSAYENKARYRRYLEECSQIKRDIGHFDVTVNSSKMSKLIAVERELFNDRQIMDPSVFSITVILYSIYYSSGNVRDSKEDTFSQKQILNLLERVENKNGKYYNDERIWRSICKVERGMVSLDLRYRILERDHHRCRKCGKTDAFENLEIDHIIPISKGGKSSPDNLQVLCHQCNKEKDSKTIKY